MGRNRVIYQSKAVYAGPDKGTDGAYGDESGASDTIKTSTERKLWV